MPFLARRLLDLRGRPLLEDHLADVVGQVEQLADRRAPLVAGAAALDAADALVERVRVLERRIEPRFLEQRARRPAPAACSAWQMMRTSRCASTQLSAETNWYASTPMFRKRPSTSSTLLAWTVVNTRWPVSAELMAICAVSVSRISPTMILSGIVAQDRAQAARERQPLLLVDRDLRDARAAGTRPDPRS